MRKDEIDNNLKSVFGELHCDEPCNKKKYMRAKECIARYSIGRTKLVELAREAGAVIKIDSTLLIDVDKFDKFIETFRVPGGPVK